ncbi:hypothetical protein BTO28_10275 [Domibacillus epiphyticus]|uniref:DAGKc domain-containing protein n=2 Tax=Domibacillus epiphyticus TaxID=1714355 RepID=A0A1V2A711_9BACI|nr:hypothetical protein BTO28_10275 [Domibacillus epiphyticus]
MRFKNGLFLMNKHAGKGAVSSYRQIVPVLRKAVEHLDEHVLAPGEAEDVCFRYGSNYDVIIIYGGDGTVHECINGIARLGDRPVVAVLPGGTCNDFCRSIGVSDIESACHLIKNGNMREVDIGVMNDRFFVNFWGIGLITDTSENIDHHKKSLIGKLSYYLSALETIRKPDYFHYMIEANGNTLEGDAIMAVALNGNYIGAIDLPFEADHEDGFLDLIIVKEAGFPLVKEFLHKEKIKMTGDHAANLEHHRVTSFSLSTTRPLRIDMDGEVYAFTPSNCSIKKKHIQFISSL